MKQSSLRYFIDQGRPRDKIIFSWWVGPKKIFSFFFLVSMLEKVNLSNFKCYSCYFLAPPTMRKLFCLVVTLITKQINLQPKKKSKSLKLYKQIYETLKFEIFDRQGQTTRQNNFLVVGGAPFFFLKCQHAWKSKSLELQKQIYETIKFEIFHRPGQTTRQNNFLMVGGAKK